MSDDSAKANRSLETLSRPWVLAILLLHVGFLGIPLYMQTKYGLRTRLLICLASILYAVFAVAVIWIGGLYLWNAFRSL